ncbi:hypothetical protein K491DRAFT_707969 [Lophiostoma macrostomum CBS 122681]|uniref:DUF7580 domain-containing protein n=1 Tax=Lophiostoma macrostomum CBS 122681 TaxID=1314788 RepID=A0A6A6SPE9_9PLEO|nr:hypothetical protein K491DRAFT_707969 [Lophiostoma macrostomum CBS 122681]
MSGIEIAGLVLGIVPVVVEILKSYSATKDRLRSFAGYSQVVHDVQLRLRVAATNFSNNCELLLKAAVDDARELAEMVDDPEHSGWQDESLEQRLRRALSRDYDLCEELVRIRDVLRDTRTRLSVLGRTLPAGRSDSRVALLGRHMHDAFDISRKENDYRKWLDDLDNWNTRLGLLRDQRRKLRKRRGYGRDCVIRRSVPKRFADIHTASQNLHDALRDSWSCTNVSHVGHQAKLSLDAQADWGTAQLDMAIACRRKPAEGSERTGKDLNEPPIWLQIRSITTNELCTSSAPKRTAIVDNISASLHAPPTTPVSNTKVPTSTSIVEKAKNSLKRDHSSVCCHLSKACQSGPCKDTGLGYLEPLETSQSFRFMFYDAARNTETNVARHLPGSDSRSIRPELSHLQTLHQLTLAYKLATAVLQYHSTSWLAEDWSLEDIAYFNIAALTRQGQPQASEEDITKALQSLHLDTQFPSKAITAKSSSTGDVEQLKYVYGIRNLTLANLGVALLEIGSKKEVQTASAILDSLGTAPHSIISARKILHEDPPSLATLGKRYIDMARRCLECDFNCGSDLSDDALRSAIYTDVVCVLGDMITDWKKFIGLI